MHLGLDSHFQTGLQLGGGFGAVIVYFVKSQHTPTDEVREICSTQHHTHDSRRDNSLPAALHGFPGVC